MPRFRQILYTVVSVALLVYVVLRGALLSITIDEARSYYILKGWDQDVLGSNNHFLNTQLMKFVDHFIGNQEWMLRLPNLILFVIYLIAVWIIIRKAGDIGSFIFGLIALLALPFQLEFFALARGYGMSMGFFMISVALFLTSLNTEKAKTRDTWIIASAICSGLALASSLTIINTILVFAVLVLFTLILRKKTGVQNVGQWTILSVALLFGVILSGGLYVLFELRDMNELYYGLDNFPRAGMNMVRTVLYGEITDGSIALVWSLLAVIIIAGAIRVIRKKPLDYVLFITLGLFAGSLMLIALEHLILDTLLPLDRTGIIYAPLMSLFLYALYEGLSGSPKRVLLLRNSFGLILCVILISNLVKGINLKEVKPWRFNQDMREVSWKLHHLADPEKDPATVENHFMFRTSLNYYIWTRDLHLDPKSSRDLPLHADFLLLFEDPIGPEPDSVRLKQEYELIEYYQDSKLYMYRRKSDREE